MAAALDKKGRTLYLFDELAKGTNPLEGEAILTAVLTYLSDQSCLALAATHYDKPAHMEKATQYAIKGIASASLDKLVVDKNNSLNSQLDLINQLIDYRLVKLSDKIKPPLNAIPIAEILGLPAEIILKAKRIMKQQD
ncbi:MAG: hypothetical protein R6V77_02710 [Candidatus Cloacimonadaceae bacterium]